MQRRIVVAAVALLVLAAWLVFNPSTSKDPSPEAGLQRLLGSGNTSDAFERALATRAFTFPADHGAHPTFRNEWWYFTGILHTTGGRRFGFELTFFRVALAAAPVALDTASGWRTNQVYSAHFALTDVDAAGFSAFHRMARGAQGLAGARAEPFAVWLENWRVAGGRDWALSAAADGVALELAMQALREPVLNGDAGFSQKSSAAGNASYYYSMPRLQSTGTLALQGEQFEVSGLVWLDREWSTSALGDDQTGWDWFAIHLDDGSDLMYYRLRDLQGNTHSYSGGTWSTPSGTMPLRHDAVELQPMRYWVSPTGIRYPVAWRLLSPTLGLQLDIAPLVDAQWLNFEVPYWEGAVEVRGRRGAHAVSGEGYVELTGYPASP